MSLSLAPVQDEFAVLNLYHTLFVLLKKLNAFRFRRSKREPGYTKSVFVPKSLETIREARNLFCLCPCGRQRLPPEPSSMGWRKIGQLIKLNAQHCLDYRRFVELRKWFRHRL